MTFEEQFPGLCEQDEDGIYKYIGEEDYDGMSDVKDSEQANIAYIDGIKIHCIDKKILREILMKFFPSEAFVETNNKDGIFGIMIGTQPFESMLIELGLEK